MTPEAQRVAIAEFAGWKRVEASTDLAWGADAGKNKCWMCLHQLPNCPNDLNAMHEAEKRLDRIKNVLPEDEGFDTQFGTYLTMLDIVIKPTCAEEDIYENVVTAAAQRAEALLRTIGKWVD
jgi:hypothetical protein